MILTSLLLFVASGSPANWEAESTADRLISVLKVEQQALEAQHECIRSANRFDVEAQYVVDPSIFGNIHPGSSNWTFARESYLTIIRAACRTHTPADIANLTRDAFSKNVSEAAMQRLLVFFQSPDGQRFVEASLKASQSVNLMVYRPNKAILEQEWIDHFERIKKLREPKEQPKGAEVINPIP